MNVERMDVDSRIARVASLVTSSPDAVVLCEPEESERQRLLRAIYYSGFQDGRNIGIKQGFSDATVMLEQAMDKL